MIVSRKEMLEIEEKSGLSSFELINLVGKKLATHLLPYLEVNSNILILSGNGNNGADSFVLISNLKQFHINLILVSGLPKNSDAMKLYKQVPSSIIQPLSSLDTCLKNCDVIIDGIFGFGYHGKRMKYVQYSNRYRMRKSQSIVLISTLVQNVILPCMIPSHYILQSHLH